MKTTLDGLKHWGDSDTCILDVSSGVVGSMLRSSVLSQSLPSTIRHLTITGDGVSNITVIGDDFLKGSGSLETLDIKHLNNVSRIGSRFLSGCKSLRSLDLSPLSNVTQIRNEFLAWCESLTYLDLSPLSNITRIGNEFLKGSGSLKNIDLSPLSNITQIGDEFLAWCGSLASLDLSPLKKITQIGDGFLAWCKALTNLDLRPLSNITQIGNKFLRECKSLASLDISPLSSVTEIGDEFLSSCESLKSLNVGPRSNITQIGNDFLAWCKSLTSLDLSQLDNTTQIGDKFLSCCSSIRKLVINSKVVFKAIPEGLKQHIEWKEPTNGDSAGSRNTSNSSNQKTKSTTDGDSDPKRVQLPIQSKSIKTTLDGLQHYWGGGDTCILDVSSEIVGSKLRSGIHGLPSTIRHLTITGDRVSNITVIGDDFLKGSGSLETLDIKHLNNVTRIGDDFLSSCESLTSLDLSPLNKTTQIGNGFLRGCRLLRSIDVSQLSNVTQIGNDFLASCESLTSLDLSQLDNTTQIGDKFLSCCSSIRKLVINSKVVFKAIPEGLKQHIECYILRGESEGLPNEPDDQKASSPNQNTIDVINSKVEIEAIPESLQQHAERKEVTDDGQNASSSPNQNERSSTDCGGSDPMRVPSVQLPLTLTGCDELIKQNPDRGEGYNFKGALMLSSPEGEGSAARDYFQKALGIDDQYADAMINLTAWAVQSTKNPPSQRLAVVENVVRNFAFQDASSGGVRNNHSAEEAESILCPKAYELSTVPFYDALLRHVGNLEKTLSQEYAAVIKVLSERRWVQNKRMDQRVKQDVECEEKKMQTTCDELLKELEKERLRNKKLSAGLKQREKREKEVRRKERQRQNRRKRIGLLTQRDEKREKERQHKSQEEIKAELEQYDTRLRNMVEQAVAKLSAEVSELREDNQKLSIAVNSKTYRPGDAGAGEYFDGFILQMSATFSQVLVAHASGVVPGKPSVAGRSLANFAASLCSFLPVFGGVAGKLFKVAGDVADGVTDVKKMQQLLKVLELGMTTPELLRDLSTLVAQKLISVHRDKLKNLRNVYPKKESRWKIPEGVNMTERMVNFFADRAPRETVAKMWGKADAMRMLFHLQVKSAAKNLKETCSHGESCWTPNRMNRMAGCLANVVFDGEAATGRLNRLVTLRVKECTSLPPSLPGHYQCVASCCGVQGLTGVTMVENESLSWNHLVYLTIEGQTAAEKEIVKFNIPGLGAGSLNLSLVRENGKRLETTVQLNNEFETVLHVNVVTAEYVFSKPNQTTPKPFRFQTEDRIHQRNTPSSNYKVKKSKHKHTKKK